MADDKDTKQNQAKAQPKAEPEAKETTEGGVYIVNDTRVNANGEPVKG